MEASPRNPEKRAGPASLPPPAGSPLALARPSGRERARSTPAAARQRPGGAPFRCVGRLLRTDPGRAARRRRSAARAALRHQVRGGGLPRRPAFRAAIGRPHAWSITGGFIAGATVPSSVPLSGLSGANTGRAVGAVVAPPEAPRCRWRCHERCAARRDSVGAGAHGSRSGRVPERSGTAVAGASGADARAQAATPAAVSPGSGAADRRRRAGSAAPPPSAASPRSSGRRRARSRCAPAPAPA